MLRNQPGIHSVKVALLAERAVVEYDPELWTEDKIMSVSATICQSWLGRFSVPWDYCVSIPCSSPSGAFATCMLGLAEISR